ncbi:YlmH family RNA-binding protein [Streptococcus sp. 10F2]
MVKNLKNVSQHVTAGDQLFLEKAWEWIERVENQYIPVLTDFLNPHQVSLLRNLASHRELNVFDSADLWPSEQSRVLLAPSYYELNPDDFELELLSIDFMSQFGHLTHPQVLGSLLHQTGLDRRVFGDILIGEDQVQIFMQRPIVELVLQEVRKIGRLGVKMNVISKSEQLQVQEEAQTKTIFVDSLRLDRLVASSFQVGRSKAAQLIKSNKVKVNYQERTDVSYPIKAGDRVSIRSKGRVYVGESTGLSKSGRMKVELKILARK